MNKSRRNGSSRHDTRHELGSEVGVRRCRSTCSFASSQMRLEIHVGLHWCTHTVTGDRSRLGFKNLEGLQGLNQWAPVSR